MALPLTLSGVSLPQQNYYCGPFKSSGGAFYIIFILDSDGTPVVGKATDPSISFTLQDAANNPVAVPLSMWVHQESDVLHIATQESNGNGADVHYHTFNMATDAWVLVDDLVETPTDAPPDSGIACAIVVRSGPDIVIAYAGDTDIEMSSARSRWDYARKESGSWTVGINIAGDGLSKDIVGGSIVRGASDLIHLAYFVNSDRDLEHRSLNSSNTLSSVEDIDSQTVSSPLHHVGPGVFYDDAGDARVRFPYQDAAANIASGKIDNDGTPTTDTAISDNDVFDVNGTMAACFAVDGKTIHLLYSDLTTKDLFHDSNIDDAGWGTDVEELDAVDVNRISCNVYDRSGSKLAYVYDDGGTTKYNEVDLDDSQAVTGATITSTATLFAPTVIAEQFVTGAFISSGAALFAPTVLAEQAVTTAFIPSGVSLFAPTLAHVVAGASIASTATLFAPTILAEQAITTAFIASSAALFAPTVLAEQAVTTAFISSGATLFAPTLAHVVAGATIASTATLFAPTLAHVVAGATIASTATLFAPTISQPGAQAVTAAFISSGAALFAPTILAEQAITTAFISSGVTLFAPELAHVVAGATITSTATLFAPTIVLEQAVTTAFISSGATLFAPTLAHVVTGASIASTATLFAPTVLAEQAVTTAFISSGATLFAPTLAHVVAGATIASTATLFAPTLAHVVAGATIASTATLFAPTISQAGAQAVTAAFIASGVTLFAPTIAISLPELVAAIALKGSFLFATTLKGSFLKNTTLKGNLK